jgi:hypothetical protein
LFLALVVELLSNGVVYHVLSFNEFMSNFLVLRSRALEVVLSGQIVIALVGPFGIPVTR